MFCPKCGTQNDLKQGFCRQCGQALSGVRLALEGSADQSLQKLKASQQWINGGSATLSVFTLIGLAIAIVGFALNDPTFTGIAIINLLLATGVEANLHKSPVQESVTEHTTLDLQKSGRASE